MSIRFRLAMMCLVIALLPAIPLSILVSDLLHKSFNVGLSETMESALESGMTVSRKHLEELRLGFEKDVGGVVARLPGAASDSAVAAGLIGKGAPATATSNPADSRGTLGFILARDTGASPEAALPLPADLTAFSKEPTFVTLTENTQVVERAGSEPSPRDGTVRDLAFYETENRAVQFALWSPPADSQKYLFYRKADPEFLLNADKLLAGRQLFAQLRLAQERLNRSFFYPFILIYAVILLLSLAFAFLMAERLVAPIRRLVDATSTVAAGDWSVQLEKRGGGEIGRLVESFNRMVKRLDSQRQRLVDLEKMASWREMARHLAHEIKNPLLPIRLTVQEMKDQYSGEDKRYGELLSESVRVVDDELAALQKLVREFSSFAKMPGLSLTSGSIEQVVKDVAKLYPQVGISVYVEEGLPSSVFDPDQMRRVLVNLFDNSVSALPSGEKAAVQIRVRRAGDALILEFADNGPGIPAEHIPRIFDPYFSTRKGGTGIGLAMVRNIVLLHEGKIGASSMEGGGAVFTITLPLTGPSDSPIGEVSVDAVRKSAEDGPAE